MHRWKCTSLVFTFVLLPLAAVGQTSSFSSSVSVPALLAADAPLPDAPSQNPPGMGIAGDSTPLEQEPHARVLASNTPKHVFTDLGHIAISPSYLRTRDLKWMLPLTGATIAAFATDTHAMRDVVSHNPSFNQTSGNVSDGLRDGFIAVPVLFYGMGVMGDHERLRETGILSGEAMVDALVVDEFSKLVTFRERPNVDNGRGNFYIGSSGGVNSSFVSGHSMIAWSSAAVMADESHNRWAKVAIYAAAAGVSVSRVTAQQHFPTDVLLGSAGGWLIGHYVFRAHHHADVSSH